MSAIEKFTMLTEKSRNTTQSLAKLALEGQEKVMRLNIDGAKEFVEASAEQIRKSIHEASQVHSAEEWQKMIMNNIQRGTDLNISLIELTKRMQAEFACIMEGNIRAIRNGAMKTVGDYGITGKKSG